MCACLNFLKKYLDKWSIADMYNLHTTGCSFSLLAKLLCQEKNVICIAQRAFSEYSKYTKDFQSGDNSVKSQVAYFLHGIMSFFVEDLTFNLDQHSIFLWIKTRFQYRINKVFSDQSMNDPKFRQTMIYFQHYFQKAIFNNIDNVLQYFKSDPNQLTKVIKTIDSDISDQTQWNYTHHKGYYVFTGSYPNNEYQINIFSGIVLKNGSELAGLSQNIKQNKEFIQVFGKNRDLEVYPEIDGSLRTRNDFAQYFPNEPNSVVLFQFKTIDDRVIISKIIKRQNEQERYCLIPQSVLAQSNFKLPQLYLTIYFSWFSLAQKVLVFRQKGINVMKDVKLVMLAEDHQGEVFIISKIRVIDNSFKGKSIVQLKQRDAKISFNQLILHAKKSPENKAITILSSIEHPEYILQISSPVCGSDKRETQFWLHRYSNVKFILSEQHGLLYNRCRSYAIAKQYGGHPDLPWRPEDGIKCLVMKKIQEKIAISNKHIIQIIVPDTDIQSSGQKIIIPSDPTLPMNLFSYELHDHFRDLRAKSLLQQFHLAGLSAVSYNPELMMNNLQFAVYLLRSCEGLQPFSPAELRKLRNVLNNAAELNQYILILICHVIYKSSKLLSNTLPFNIIQKEGSDGFEEYNRLVQDCKLAYRSDLASEKVSLRLQLSETELKILNIHKYKQLFGRVQKPLTKWEIKYKRILTTPAFYQQCIKECRDDLNESYWKKDKVFQINEKQNLSLQQLGDKVLKQTRLQGEGKLIEDQNKDIQISVKSFVHRRKKVEGLTLENKLDQLKQLMSSKYTILRNISELKEMLKIFQNGLWKDVDYISERRCVLKQIDFTRILCDETYLSMYYPDASQNELELFKNGVQLWMELTIEYNSISRMITIITEDSRQINSLLRQIQSPRAKISKNLPFLCYEAELKIQIWASQFEIFTLLNASSSGTVTQLNMGEGKTQVIIPMIILNEVYNKKQYLPRVNILTALYPQAQRNYFKFLSVTGFKLHSLPFCFNREVRIGQESINTLQYAYDLFKTHSFILTDRDSMLSMILKQRQQLNFKKKELNLHAKLDGSGNRKDLWIFRNTLIVDIYDEVDAIMTSGKSFVYAVGNSSPLPDSRIRFQYTFIFLQIIIKELLPQLIEKKMAVLQECDNNAFTHIKEGKFPNGLRILSNASEKDIAYFRKRIIEIFFTSYRPDDFQFCKKLTSEQKQRLMKYCQDGDTHHNFLPDWLSVEARNKIFLLRGLLGKEIIQSCMKMRNGVNYGAPGADHIKRIGVPYEAADVPSRKSEYSEPEVAIVLSYLSYYRKGLTLKEFKDALGCLLSLSASSRHKNYGDWLRCIEVEQKRPASVKDIKQINQQSNYQTLELYEAFRYCRATIAFWLTHCVFPTNLAQFIYSLTSSCHDLADSKTSMGFSGTKDTYQIFPQYLTLKLSQNQDINGTDGKMIISIIENTIDVLKIKENDDDLWQRFCESALELNADCIIDAGAVLTGKSLQDVIVPWISRHKLFKKDVFKGILYCNQNRIWKVYDTSSNSTIDRDGGIPESETFVIFDEARTRGADIKMKTEAKAVLSLGPYMPKDKLMQAAGRLRKIGSNQRLYLLGTQQIYNSIKSFELSSSKQQKIMKILKWVRQNSVNDIQKMLYQYSNLMFIHLSNKNSETGMHPQQFDPTLEAMYKGKVKVDTIENVCHSMANLLKEQGHRESEELKKFLSFIGMYGGNLLVKCHALDNICERQIEVIKEEERITEVEICYLKAIPEAMETTINKGPISTINIQLNRQLSFSDNFIRCTTCPETKTESRKYAENQLSLVHFAMIVPSSSELIAITQKEASYKIEQGVRCLAPTQMNETPKSQFIVRFQDLSIKSLCVSTFKLERALTDAQYFNGQQNFEDKSLISEMVENNLTANPGLTVDNILCHFLERRRTVEDKFRCSDLQSVLKQICSAK